MKNIAIFFSLILALAFQGLPLLARDGERGRGKGGGVRTPSMSRSARPEGGRQRGETRQQSRPQARPQARTQARTQARPQENQRPSGRSRESRRIGRGNQVSRPQSVQRQTPALRQESPRRSRLARTPSMSAPQVRPSRALRTQRRGNIRDTVKQFRDARPRKEKQHLDRNSLRGKFKGQRQHSARVKDRVKKNHSHYHDWFSNNFFDRHGFHPHYHLRDRWKRWRWTDFNSWFGYGWNSPYYYDYGYPIELPADYETYYLASPQVTQYVEVPVAASVGEEWLPLGVFAAAKNEEEAAFSNMFMELAADKQGNLSGTHYNSSTDQIYAMDGYIDQQTQEAFWRFTNQSDSPLISTGLFNLTQDVVPILIDFPEDGDQNWVLVRVEE